MVILWTHLSKSLNTRLVKGVLEKGDVKINPEVFNMADLLVVKAKIKDVIGDYNVAGDFAEELDKQVRMLVSAAAKRAEANGRRTVMAKDL